MTKSPLQVSVQSILDKKECTYYFSTTLVMRAALKSKRTTLLALLSFPRAFWPVP